MNGPRWLILALLCSSTQAVAQSSTASPKTRVVVLPFVSVSPQLGPKAGAKAAAIFSDELKSNQNFEVLAAAAVPSDEPGQRQLTEARALAKESTALRARKQFAEAIDKATQSLQKYEAAASQLTSLTEVAQAAAQLAASQLNLGRDDEAKSSVELALSLSTGQPTEAALASLAQGSTAFLKVLVAARASSTQAASAVLEFESVPEGASLFLDGEPYGLTPQRVTKVPAGKHFWRAQLSTQEVLGGVAVAVAQKVTKVSVKASQPDALSRVFDALARNRVDSAAAGAFQETATSLKADLVLAGLMLKETDGVSLRLLAFANGSGFRKLPAIRFDAEMLSAGLSFLPVASRLSQEGARIGEAFVVGGGVVSSSEWPGVKMREAAFRVTEALSSATKDLAQMPDSKSTQPTPQNAPVRTPLGRKPLQAKP